MAVKIILIFARLPSRNDNVNESRDTVSTVERVKSLEIRSKSDHKEKNKSKHERSPSLRRLVKLSLPEWLYAVLGSLGASIFGSFRPVLAYVVGLIVTAYYRADARGFDVDKWCLIIACMAIVVLVATVVQHFYFGIMGEKITERIRRMMFSGNKYLLSFFLSFSVLMFNFFYFIFIFSHAPE